MNKYQLLKLFLSLQKNSEKGLSLIELIVALVMSGIVLTMAASGFINVLRANQDVESKSLRNTGLQRALAFLQEDLKQATEAIAVTKVSGTPNYDPNCTSATDSQECLKLRMPDERTVYYAYKNISSGDNIFLKPGILQRQAYIGTTPVDDSNLPTITNLPTADAWKLENTTVADGLIIDQPTEFDPANPGTLCDQNSVNWTDTNVYGDDGSQNGGFRFCLEPNLPDPPRLVRVFLHGRTVDDKKINGTRNSESGVNIIGFARGESRMIFKIEPNSTTVPPNQDVDIKIDWTKLQDVTYDLYECTVDSGTCNPFTGSPVLSNTSPTVTRLNKDLSQNLGATPPIDKNVCYGLKAQYTSGGVTKESQQIRCVK